MQKIIAGVRYYAKGIYRKFIEDDVVFLGSGIAFNGLLCLIPLLLLLTSAVGILLSSSDVTLQKVNELLEVISPPQTQAENIKETLRQVVRDIVAFKTSMGLFGGLTLLWTSASLFAALRNVLNRVYKISLKGNIFLNQLRDLLMVVAVGVLFILSNWLTWVSSLAEAYSGRFLKLVNIDVTFFSHGFTFSFSLLIVFMMFFIIYRFVPHEHPSLKVTFISSISTTILWQIMVQLFTLYLTTFNTFRKIYGTYAFFLILLFWIYFSSLVFVLGAEIGQLHRERSNDSKM